MNNLVLIDGNSLINRAFYATPPLSAKDGTPTNAVYAFVNMLVKLIGDVNPKYLLVAFDRKEPTFRHKIFPDYKGTRKPMPDDLRPQIDLLKTVLDTMRIARYEQPSIEADDILGSLSRKFKIPTIIVTGDKDSFQLVDETTSVFFTKRGISDIEVYNNDNFTEKTGITPSQIIDLKSLMGDSSDNIPGVPGVGEKTALNLVKTYGTLENLYDNVDTLSGKLREKIESSREIAALSKTLATINTSVEIPYALDDLTFDFPFPYETKLLFSNLDLKNLLKKDSLFKSENTDDATPIINDNQPIASLIVIKYGDKLPDFDKKVPLAIVYENDFYVSDGKTECFMKIPENFFEEGISFEDALKLIKPLVEDKDRNVVLWSKKALKTKLYKYGLSFDSQIDDVSIEKYLVDFSGKDDSLSDVIKEYDLDASKPASSLLSLHSVMSEKLKNEGLIDLYRDLELPLCDVLFDMERAGFKIDEVALKEAEKNYESRLKAMTEKITELAGCEFNLNSPKQLGVILFEKLGLKSGKKNKNGYSTSADILEKLKDEHPIVAEILKYRQIQKLYSTYIKGFEPLVEKGTGLVHTCFNQTLTSTGRLSSKEPNLQNIPVREQEGRELRKLFVSSFDGGKIAGADYSQIELRLLAHFSGCNQLIEAFNEGKDVHALTASQVFEVPLAEVTKDMRQSAKAVNFGIIYGISDFGLSEQLKISPKRAGEYIKKYFEMYPSVKEYMDKNVEFARKNGYVTTLLGRKRYIREINSPNFNLRSFGERAAMNMPLQGTAADIIKIAMISVHSEMKKRGLKSKLILQVHDELIVDALAEEVGEVLEILKNKMENAVKLSVPLTVETECGDRWYDAK